MQQPLALLTKELYFPNMKYFKELVLSFFTLSTFLKYINEELSVLITKYTIWISVLVSNKTKQLIKA